MAYDGIDVVMEAEVGNTIVAHKPIMIATAAPTRPPVWPAPITPRARTTAAVSEPPRRAGMRVIGQLTNKRGQFLDRHERLFTARRW